MSFYSPIDRRINADRWFRDLSHLAQLLWLRLLTGPHVTPVAGLWPATEHGLATQFKMPIVLFRKLFAEVSLNRDGAPNGKVLADWRAGVLWFPRALHVPANQPKNENTLRGWAKHIELVPECELRDQALGELTDWVLSFPKRFPNGLPDGFPQPYRERLNEPFRERVPRAKQEQEQEHEQEQEQEQHPPPQRFRMHSGWQPRPETIAALEVGLIPTWAIDQLVARFRGHFCAVADQKRTDEQWNQSCSKWVFGDWQNGKKRPEKPPADDENAADGWADA